MGGDSDLPDSIAKTLFPTKMGHVDLILGKRQLVLVSIPEHSMFFVHLVVFGIRVGIMPSGASYLLLPEDKFFRTFRRSSAKPWLSTRFKSLSPVHFSDFEAFKKKLNSFTSKKTKKGGPRDRSKVNTEYTIHGADVEGEKGIIRAGFEHQRQEPNFSSLNF